MNYKVILRNGRYALLEAKNEYIVACGFDETQPEKQQWSQGYYFSHWNASENDKQTAFFKAVETFRIKTEPNYISRSRLEELATQFKDALLEDDKFSALVFFEDFCEMTESEKEWFGIDEEEM